MTPATPSSLPASVSFPSALKNKTLEEIVVGWNEELEAQVAEFQKQAIEIGQWDKRILANGEKLLAVHSRVTSLEKSQSDLEQSLNYVVAQQSELETLLDGIEKELKQEKQPDLNMDDKEREEMYNKAAQAQERISELGLQLASTVDTINRSANSGATGLAGVSQVMNAHLEALAWIEAQIKELKVSTDTVQQLASKATLQQGRLH